MAWYMGPSRRREASDKTLRRRGEKARRKAAEIIARSRELVGGLRLDRRRVDRADRQSRAALDEVPRSPKISKRRLPS